LAGFPFFVDRISVFIRPFLRILQTVFFDPSRPSQRFHPTAVPFSSGRFVVLQVPPLFLAGWEPYYIRLHPAKGLVALWTPGVFGAALLTLQKRQKP
jgi:hypothetical protein